MAAATATWIADVLYAVHRLVQSVVPSVSRLEVSKHCIQYCMPCFQALTARHIDRQRSMPRTVVRTQCATSPRQYHCRASTT